MASNEADLGGRLFPGGESQRGLGSDPANTPQAPELGAQVLESATTQNTTPSVEAHPPGLDRRGFLKIGLGVGAALGATALGRLIIPGLSSDGDGSGDGGGSSNQPILTGETPTTQVTQSPVETATPSPTITPEDTPTPEKEPKTLKDWADKINLRLSTQARFYHLDNPQWKDLVAQEFAAISLGGGTFAWSNTEPIRRKSYNFANTDKVANFAQANNLELDAGALIYPRKENLPGWLVNGNYSRDELGQLMTEHITATVNHYKGKLKQLIVVNEPYRQPYASFDVLRDKYGPDYVDLCFQAVKDADPSIVKILNHYSNDTSTGENTALTRNTASKLKSLGLIDGVGLEMHQTGHKVPSKQDLISTMRSYELPVYITELDVNMHGVPGAKEELVARQAKIYETVVEAALESGVCKGINFYDVGDNLSWLEFDSLATYGSGSHPPSFGGVDADATLWDGDFKPKPAYTAVLEVIKRAAKVSP